MTDLRIEVPSRKRRPPGRRRLRQPNEPPAAGTAGALTLRAPIRALKVWLGLA